MTPEQWKQVKSLFEQITALPPEQEQSYLEQHCSDAEVFKELSSLLAHHKNANDFLQEIDNKATPTNNPRQTNREDSEATPSTSIGKLQQDFAGTARFAIQRRLGAGGFGVVYQAYDRERNSVVALKTLNNGDAGALYRFKKEFRSLADLIHPNLAALYELFSEQEQWFFTMEMIHGQSFLDHVKISNNIDINSISEMETISVGFTPLELSDIKPIFKSGNIKPTKCPADLAKLRKALKQLVIGLSALHKAGKLHRDIKPSNVLVTKEGRVVILDFGLVSDLTDQGVNKISSENIVGTPAYMSPEHAIGQPISPASDWYSVGIMLYEALTGELPFTGSGIEMILSKQRFQPMRPCELLADIPEDLSNLCMDLLKKDASLRPTGADILRIIGETDELEVIPVKPTTGNYAKIPFIGREKELAILNEAWQKTKLGQGVTIYIQGRSGMGKSTLVRHFLEQLESSEPELLTFAGRCYEQESVPYKVLDSIIDLLSRYLKSLSKLEVEAILPLDVLALARLFPVLRQINSVANSRRSVLEIPDSQELRRKAFGALRELLARLANRKDLIIFIDDLQWGDIDSAALISELLRPPDAPRMLLIGSYRSEEAETSIFLRSLFEVQDAAEKPETREITIEGLSSAEASDLVTSLLGKEVGKERALKQAEVIVQESHGSPFFISELVQYALMKADNLNTEIDHQEMTIDKVVSARIDQLPEDGRRYLEMVAVSGQPLARAVAKHAAGTDADEQILPLLRANHLIRSTSTITFEEIDTYHDRIREAVLASLSPQVLKDYNRCLAMALEAVQNNDPERLAKHFQEAGEYDRAADHQLNAAEKADEALAFDRAAHLYRQSLELKSPTDSKLTTLKIKLGNALANAGRGAESAKAYLAATSNTERQDLFKLQHKAAEQFLNAGHIDEGLELLNIVLKKAGMKLAATSTSAVLSILQGRTKLWLKGVDYQLRQESEIPAEKLSQIDVCWTALDSLSTVDMLRASDFHTQHLLLALDAGEPYRLARALLFESVFIGRTGNRGSVRASKFIDMATTLANKVQRPELFAMINFVKSTLEIMYGHWKPAWELFCIGEKITKEQCQGENYVFALRGIDQSISLAMRALIYTGNLSEMMTKLPIVFKEAQEHSNLFLLTNLRIACLYLKNLASDEPEKAAQELELASNLWTKREFNLQSFWKMLALIDIGLYTGQGITIWDQINSYAKEMKKSLLIGFQNNLIESLFAQARAALATARDGINVSHYLNIAKKNAKKMFRERTSYGEGWANLILAGIDAIDGNVSSALNYLNLAEQKFNSSHMELYAAACRYRRGELLANDEGKALIRNAENWMHNQKIKNPARMIHVLAPGRWQHKNS